MKKIGILVGEDADLPSDAIRTFPIRIYSYPVHFQSFTDTSSFYSRLRSAAARSEKDTPKTSQPSIGTFQELYKISLQEFESIIVFTISSTLSGSHNAAIQARKLLTPEAQSRVYIIDSKNSTGGEGLLVLKAARLASVKEINVVIPMISDAARDIHLLGVVDTVTWLKRGGRISSVQAVIITNMLKAGFRPILTLRDGQIVAKKIQLNAKEKATALFAQFKEEVFHEIEQGKHVSVIITHGDCIHEAEKLRDMIVACGASVSVRYISILSPVLGAYLGPDSLVLSWLIG